MAESDAWEFGIICDRRTLGLGKALLCTAGTADTAWARATCGLAEPHPHLLVRRRVHYTPWSDPIAGETAGTTQAEEKTDART